MYGKAFLSMKSRTGPVDGSAGPIRQRHADLHFPAMDPSAAARLRCGGEAGSGRRLQDDILSSPRVGGAGVGLRRTAEGTKGSRDHSPRRRTLRPGCSGFRRRWVLALALVFAALPARAQWVSESEQFSLPAGHNWVFRRSYPQADRLFHAFDYGHPILYQAL